MKLKNKTLHLKNKSLSLGPKFEFSSKHLTFFGVIFASLGAYIVYQSFAAGPLHRTNYDSSNTSLWAEHGEQVKDPSRIDYVSDSARGKVQKVEVWPGDNNVAGSGSGERAEVINTKELKWTDNQTMVMSWSLYIDNNFASPSGGWNNFTQVHASGGGNQAAWQMNLVGDSAELKMRIYGGGNWIQSGQPTGSVGEWFSAGLLPKNQWHDFVVEVKFSCNGAGYAKVWRNNAKVMDVQNRKIGYCGDPGMYWKQGFYRAAYTKTTKLLFDDTFRWGSSADAFTHYGWSSGTTPTPTPTPTLPPPSSSFSTDGRYYLTSDERELLKQNTSSKAWAQTAWAKTKSAADSALSATPQPADPTKTYTQRESSGCSGTSVGWLTCLYVPGSNDGNKVHNLGLAYVVTGDVKYGNKAKEILLAWARKYKTPPPLSSIGHHIAESGGPMVKMLRAYDLVEGAFTESERTEFKNWAKVFISRGKTWADNSRDSPWVGNVTFNGDTSNPAWSGNSASWPRAMAVLAGAVVGGTELTNILNWNWQHTTPKGNDYGWNFLINDWIIAGTNGETFEGRDRKSVDYAHFGWQALVLIADVAKHAGFSTNLFTYTTSSGKALNQVPNFYSKFLTNETSPSYEQVASYCCGNWPTTASRWRGFYELIYKNTDPNSSLGNLLKGVVNWGGDTKRGNNYDVYTTSYGALTAELFLGATSTTTTPPLPPNTSSSCKASSTSWQNNAITPQSGLFTASFDMIPSASKIDANTGFSSGPASAYTNLATAIRFNPSGFIDVRSGSTFQASTSVAYSANQTYKVRMLIDVVAKKYDVYVTPPGSTEIKIASGYSFRTEQSSVSQLANWAMINEGTSHQVCNMTIATNSAPSTTTSSGDGLSATYYNNIDFTGTSLSRLEPTINFSYPSTGVCAPSSGIGCDTFSARWTGRLLSPKTEVFTLYTDSDDGIRLWINDALIINNWTNHAVTTNSAKVSLSAGTYYKIKLEYYENTGNGVAKLYWSSPSIAKQIVPKANLFSK